MPFVKRNENGEIEAVSHVLVEGHSEEYLPTGDEQLSNFLQELDGRASIGETDQDFVRVLEDVVDLLVEKGVILFTELPASAQSKVMLRQELRSKVSSALDLLGDD